MNKQWKISESFQSLFCMFYLFSIDVFIVIACNVRMPLLHVYGKIYAVSHENIPLQHLIENNYFDSITS